MAIWEYLLLFLSAIGGGLLGFVVKDISKSNLKVVLAFSGAYILGITVLHLMPEVYSTLSASAGKWIILGFFIQLLLERLSMGIEHGHVHPTHSPDWRFALQIMIGLCLHAFIEGMPLAAYPDSVGRTHFFFGIVLHEIPASLTLVVLLLMCNFRIRAVLWYLVIKSAMPPLGALFAVVFQLGPQISLIATAIVIGLFLHIATTILFEADSQSHHHMSKERLLAIFVGISIALLTA